MNISFQWFLLLKRSSQDQILVILVIIRRPSPSHSEMSIPGGVLLETETFSPLDQLRQRWENLNKDQSTKLQLSLTTLEQDQLSPVQMPCTEFCFVLLLFVLPLV